MMDIAAALAFLNQRERPLQLEAELEQAPKPKFKRREDRPERFDRGEGAPERGGRFERVPRWEPAEGPERALSQDGRSVRSGPIARSRRRVKMPVSTRGIWIARSAPRVRSGPNALIRASGRRDRTVPSVPLAPSRTRSARRRASVTGRSRGGNSDWRGAGIGPTRA